MTLKYAHLLYLYVFIFWNQFWEVWIPKSLHSLLLNLCKVNHTGLDWSFITTSFFVCITRWYNVSKLLNTQWFISSNYTWDKAEITPFTKTEPLTHQQPKFIKKTWKVVEKLPFFWGEGGLLRCYNNNHMYYVFYAKLRLLCRTVAFFSLNPKILLKDKTAIIFTATGIFLKAFFPWTFFSYHTKFFL